jgi:hypothetical protein
MARFLVFSQGITQGDTLRGSGQDAQVMPGGICDMHPTLVVSTMKMGMP